MFSSIGFWECLEGHELISAYRGSTQFDDRIALKAHIAGLLRLENVAVLLGAGASVVAGGKTVKQLWSDFVRDSPDSAEWLLENNFVTEQDVELDPKSIPNLEVLADKLAIAIAEWLRVDDHKLADGELVRHDINRAVIRAALLQQSWWADVSGVNFDEQFLSAHRMVLQKLTSSRQPGQGAPWIFTTNYDLAVEWAAESIDMSVVNGFIGTHSRKFSPQSFDLGFRNAQAKGEARFGAYNIYLAKLHGSLSWSIINEQYYEKQASGLWPSIHRYVNGQTAEFNSLVLPSAAKYVQTIGFVLGELIRRFAEFLARPQTCLFISGYGFGDEHINRLLTSALLNPTLQLVIYLPEFASINELGGLPLAFRKIVSLQSPRVTIVGGGAEAFFNALANDLPDPAIYNEDLKELENRLRLRLSTTNGNPA